MAENIEALVGVSPPNPSEAPDQAPDQPQELSPAEQDAVEGAGAPGPGQRGGVDRPDGLLKQRTRMVVEAAEGQGDDRTPGL
jgi:hypothetical protein